MFDLIKRNRNHPTDIGWAPELHEIQNDMVFTHVLFPFDYSDQCRRAALSVKDLVQKTGAKLTILNVVGDPGMNYPASAAFSVPQSERDQIVAASTRFLREYASEAFGTLPVALVVEMGDPAHEIIRFAAENQVDLIMMPTAGRGPFRQFLLGSVTAKVLDEVGCPVWTDAHRPQNGCTPEQAGESILCAVDDTDESISIMRSARNFANLYSAELYVVHGVPEFDARFKMLRPEYTQEVHDSVKTKIEQRLTKAGLNLSVCVREGAVSEVVRQSALGYKAQLVVIGRGHLQGFLGRLRTNSYAIIRESPCPVLSV